MNEKLQSWLAPLTGLPVALIYGVLARLAFSAPDESGALSAMTCGFLFLVPIAMGALTVYFAPPHLQLSGRYAFLMPWVACIVTVLLIAAIGLEEVVCIIMALPLFLLLSSLGGWLMHLRKRKNYVSNLMHGSLLGLLLVAPYLVTPLETRLPVGDTIYHVQNQVEIAADVDTVWRNIIEVPLIQPEEQHFSIFHPLGLPKPLAATLSHEGVGGVRHASFENGLLFIEEITAWRDHDSLSFTIQRDAQRQLPAPLNQIGGRYFNVLDGTYRIEPLADGRVRLHLESTHRLSTRFDFYGGLWTRWVMWDLQDYILQIIKVRCEK